MMLLNLKYFFKMTQQNWFDLDHQYLWHPYSARYSQSPIYPVTKAQGVTLTLVDGRELIDGMASWWCAIHGYNHPQINQALKDQIDQFSHIMFGGLTHEPACLLAEKLVSITPDNLKHVFFVDSGSVAVEAAMKMAIQYWYAKKQPKKQHFITIRCGYHGDTLGAMSVCDPYTGMHTLYNDVLPKQIFVDPLTHDIALDINNMRQALIDNQQSVCAVIIEPIVQGAGGMIFYSAEYLKQLHQLCDEYQVLLIFDEIATGFGRTGKLFAMEYPAITPDICCLGKSLTGGYLTLAATLTTDNVAQTISENKPYAFMHGPTFMANPLACSAALASINLLFETDWQTKVKKIEQGLQALFICNELEKVATVRVLGAIGVVELKEAVDLANIQALFVNEGVWIRPFGKLVYIMPPYIISETELNYLIQAIYKVLSLY